MLQHIITCQQPGVTQRYQVPFISSTLISSTYDGIQQHQSSSELNCQGQRFAMLHHLESKPVCSPTYYIYIMCTTLSVSHSPSLHAYSYVYIYMCVCGYIYTILSISQSLFVGVIYIYIYCKTYMYAYDSKHESHSLSLYLANNYSHHIYKLAAHHPAILYIAQLGLIDVRSIKTTATGAKRCWHSGATYASMTSDNQVLFPVPVQAQSRTE